MLLITNVPPLTIGVKGGKEAEHTCRLLADVIRSAIESTPCSPPLPASAITLVSSRDDVAKLLSMHQVTCDKRLR